MPDIQMYFKNVIIKTVEKIEKSSFKTFNFDLFEIEKELKENDKYSDNFSVNEINHYFLYMKVYFF